MTKDNAITAAVGAAMLVGTVWMIVWVWAVISRNEACIDACGPHRDYVSMHRGMCTCRPHGLDVVKPRGGSR